MEEELLSSLVPLVLLLVASAYFSGSESAFFSLSSLEREGLARRSGRRLGFVMQKMQSSPDQVLITVLTGNMFVNVFASFFGEAIGSRLFTADSELFSIIVMTVLLLIFGEMVPKNLAVRNAAGFARFSSGPLYYVFQLLIPVRWFLNLFSAAVTRLSPLPSGQEEEPRQNLIRSAVQIGFKEGILDQSELRLVESFCDFRERSAQEIMLPRTEIAGVELSITIPELLGREDLRQMAAGGSMVPVYDGDLDHIVGYVPLRDLVPYRYGLRTGVRLQEVMKPGLSVPSSKDCADLLAEMGASSCEMAIVVDEFGGTAGIVTIRDLVEELLGYFYPSDLESVLKVSPGGYRLPGSFRIDDLESLVGRSIETESNTVGGLIIERLEELPDAGARLRVDDLELVVLKATKTRILEVEVRREQP